MNIKFVSLSILFAAAMIMQSALQAADTTQAIGQMAKIMLELQTKPSKDARMTLDKIATDTTSTDNERLLATAIKNIDKKVSPADKSIMMKIWLSPAASESEREMAGILLRLNQTPGDSAKHLLSEWAK